MVLHCKSIFWFLNDEFILICDDDSVVQETFSWIFWVIFHKKGDLKRLKMSDVLIHFEINII